MLPSVNNYMSHIQEVTTVELAIKHILFASQLKKFWSSAATATE